MTIGTCLVLIVASVFIVDYGSSVKVCPAYPDYFKFPSDRCYDNPDGSLNATQVLQRWGCTVEEYNIITNDGYQLLVIRAFKTKTHPIPIVLAHGIIMNSLSFLSLGNKSLSYQILESGRQIFFLNFRGSRYSFGHTGGLTQNDYAYWNFSLDEQILYDVPKTLELVKNVTGQKTLFIGFSMGNTIALGYASLFPKLASENLVGIISIGTACYFREIYSIARLLLPVWPLVQPFLKLIWNGKMLPREQMPLKFCASGPAQFFICYNILAPVVGYDYNGISPEHFPIVALNFQDAIGEKLAAHYSQLWGTGEYRKFSYGRKKNLEYYGAPNAPYYNLSQVSVPAAQFLGKGDIITTVKNGILVNSLLNPEVRCGVTILDYKHWTHTDFINSRFQLEYLVQPLLRKISDMESNRC